jgi:hypothetical protein
MAGYGDTPLAATRRMARSGGASGRKAYEVVVFYAGPHDWPPAAARGSLDELATSHYMRESALVPLGK